MEPTQPTSFSGRRRSSVISLDTSTASAAPPAVAPRKSSIWDDDDAAAAHPVGSTASDISARRASATDPSDPSPQYSATTLIAARKASAYDDDAGGAATASRGSASDISARRATGQDTPPWDSFAGAPPGSVGSTWACVSEIKAITGNSTSAADRNTAFYSGNIHHILQIHDGKSVDIADLEEIMLAYGVVETSVDNIITRVDPAGKRGSFYISSSMLQILQIPNISFSDPLEDPLSKLRHASSCFHKNLLSPLHFAAYIIDILKRGNFIGAEAPFMILGLYSILGVLESSTDHKLTAEDVTTFIGLWRLVKPDETHELIELTNEGDGISSFDLYNLLYRRNVFGKQRIQMFDLEGPQDPRLLFLLMDKDGDGSISFSDLQRFASAFGRSLTDAQARSLISKLDFDGDGKINLEDFGQTVLPFLSGLTWEFWVVAMLLKLEL